MAVGDAYVFPGFLTPVLTQLFFPQPQTTFLTCFSRDERRKYAGKKVRLNWVLNSQPPDHESDTLATRLGLFHFDTVQSLSSGNGSVSVYIHSSVGSVADLRTEGRWFDLRLGQYSFRGLTIVIATGFIPLSPLSVV